MDHEKNRRARKGDPHHSRNHERKRRQAKTRRKAAQSSTEVKTDDD